MTSRLAARGLRLAYGDRVVVDGLTLDVPDGRITAIVGANASGKSTVLRALARLLTPVEGDVLLDGEPVARQPTRDVARRVALLPQHPVAPDGIVVSDLVARGRTPHQRFWRQWSRADEVAVADALAQTGLTALADRPVAQLSGGQRQRVWIAMAVAQRTDILLLDEPTTSLDIAQQLEVLELLARLQRDHGRTIVAVLHDLNLACRYAHHLIAVRAGTVAATGPPTAVVTAERIREVFGIDCVVTDDPVSRTPMVVPGGSDHTVPTARGRQRT